MSVNERTYRKDSRFQVAAIENEAGDSANGEK